VGETRHFKFGMQTDGVSASVCAIEFRSMWGVFRVT